VAHTVIRHLLLYILAIEHAIIIPFTISVFTVFSVVKVRGEIGNVVLKDVEMRKHVQGKAVDWALLNMAVSNGAVLIYTAILVVFCIVH